MSRFPIAPLLSYSYRYFVFQITDNLLIYILYSHISICNINIQYLVCSRCVSSVDGYQSVLAAVLEVERDNAHTGVDIQAAKLTAQKLTENGIKGFRNKSTFLKIMFFLPLGETQYTHASKEDSDHEENAEKGDKAEDEKEKDEDDKKLSAASPPTLKVSPGNFSDLEELLFCRSPNQIKVEISADQPQSFTLSFIYFNYRRH